MHVSIKMGKRKSEIFTVAKSVVNWFEASNHGIISRDIINDITDRPKPVGEGSVQPNIADVAASDPWLNNRPQDANGIESLAEVAILAGTLIEERAEIPAATELDEQEGPAKQTFWALLHAACYECW